MYVTRDHALDARGGVEATRELADRVEVIDALHRFGLGQDLHDRNLFASAFAADAELDFRPSAVKIGIESELMTGRDSIVEIIIGMFDGRVDTTHTVSNPRVRVDGDTARLTALVEAQHLLAEDRSRFALLKNLYDVELVRDGRRWVIRRLVIDNLWYTGEPKAIFGG